MSTATRFVNTIAALGSEDEKDRDLFAEALGLYHDELKFVFRVTEWKPFFDFPEDQFIGGFILMFSDFTYVVLIAQTTASGHDIRASKGEVADFGSPTGFLRWISEFSEDARGALKAFELGETAARSNQRIMADEEEELHV